VACVKGSDREEEGVSEVSTEGGNHGISIHMKSGVLDEAAA
jgi:hypothetical protein